MSQNNKNEVFLKTKEKIQLGSGLSNTQNNQLFGGHNLKNSKQIDDGVSILP